MKSNEFVKMFGWDSVKKQIKQPTGIYGAAFDYTFMSDLKSLIESHELVEYYGGLESSKSTVNYPNFLSDEDVETTKHRLSKAIEDVESCM